MTTHIKSGIVIGICALLLVSSVASGQEKKEFDLAGEYSCVGDGDDGGEYTGTVKITAHGDAYKVQWTVGDVSFKGIGIVVGQTFAVCWAAGDGSHGVIAYKMQKDKETLVGRFTELDGDGKVLNETLTKIKAGDDE